MKKIRPKNFLATIRRRWILLAALLLLVAVIRFVPGAGELYATCLYPPISLVLSWLASFTVYSLDELLEVASILFLLFYPIIALCRRRKVLHVLRIEIETICWLTVWPYLGWGCNYFRNDILTRMDIPYAELDKTEYQAFLKEYTDSLNASYTRIESVDTAKTLDEIKAVYSTIPKEYGLAKPRSFQSPKLMAFNRLYSGVGVLGFMGPYMAESQLNLDLLPSQYAFTLSHETAHLLGVSKEAEANYWAFFTCTKSADPSIRYSGYLGMLPYVWINARGMLSEGELEAWLSTVDKRIMADYEFQREYWQALRIPLIDEMQTRIYDLMMKTNNIPTGMHNYSEVIGIVMSIRKSGERH